MFGPEMLAKMVSYQTLAVALMARLNSQRQVKHANKAEAVLNIFAPEMPAEVLTSWRDMIKERLAEGDIDESVNEQKDKELEELAERNINSLLN